MSPGIVIRRFDQLHGAGVIAGDLVETRSHDLSDGLVRDRAVQESGNGDKHQQEPKVREDVQREAGRRSLEC